MDIHTEFSYKKWTSCTRGGKGPSPDAFKAMVDRAELVVKAGKEFYSIGVSP